MKWLDTPSYTLALAFHLTSDTLQRLGGNSMFAHCSTTNPMRMNHQVILLDTHPQFLVSLPIHAKLSLPPS
jgi:hypothetical protein